MASDKHAMIRPILLFLAWVALFPRFASAYTVRWRGPAGARRDRRQHVPESAGGLQRVGAADGVERSSVSQPEHEAAGDLNAFDDTMAPGICAERAVLTTTHSGKADQLAIEPSAGLRLWKNPGVGATLEDGARWLRRHRSVSCETWPSVDAAA